MKKLITISLFIFVVVVTALLVAGLVFYQGKKDNQNHTKKIVGVNDNLAGITLNLEEISKHNKQADCWYLINGKVYNITSFFGRHPGGNRIMISSCGKDATVAYMTKDPNATSNGSKTAHSSNAINLLNNYYIGDLNQTIGQQKITDTNTVVAPPNNGYDEDEYENEDD